PNTEGFARGREAAGKALAIDPDYAPAHALLGWIAMTFDNDLAGAARHYERALALDPADPNLLRSAGVLLRDLGRLDDALALTQAVARGDPVNVTSPPTRGTCQITSRRLDEAMVSYRPALNLSPERGGADYGLGLALLLKGAPAGAVAEMQQETSEPFR